jgi:hypothetical protein
MTINKKKYNFMKHSKQIMLAAKLSGLALLATIVLTGCSLPGKKSTILKPDEAKAKAEDFINKNLLQSGTTATIKEVTEENGLYKMAIEVSGGQKIDSYMTKDGSKFFPQAMDVAKVESEAQDQKKQEEDAKKQTTESMPKKDKPTVELFVMSECPYGTQIEKGIIPAIETLGKKVDFKLKFCDYAMHGEKEVKEELTQTCISQEQGDKYFTYLKCYLKAGDSVSCKKEAKINEGNLTKCTAKIDKQYSVMKKFNDQSTWVNGRFPAIDIYAADNKKYGVKGSPSLIINGTESSSGRDSASLLASICAGFKSAPAECKKALSSAAPSAGFGYAEGTGSNTNAGCAN